MENWIKKNGACYFDYKNKDVILPDRGLFSIQKKKYKARKQDIKNFQTDMLEYYSVRKKIVPSETYEAIIWMSELDETINYLKRMKKMLNKLGISTSPFNSSKQLTQDL